MVWDDVGMIPGKGAEGDTSVAKAILSRKWVSRNTSDALVGISQTFTAPLSL